MLSSDSHDRSRLLCLATRFVIYTNFPSCFPSCPLKANCCLANVLAISKRIFIASWFRRLFSSSSILTFRNCSSNITSIFFISLADNSKQLCGNRKRNAVATSLVYSFRHFSSYPMNEHLLPRHLMLSFFLVR